MGGGFLNNTNAPRDDDRFDFLQAGRVLAPSFYIYSKQRGMLNRRCGQGRPCMDLSTTPAGLLSLSAPQSTAQGIDYQKWVPLLASLSSLAASVICALRVLLVLGS